MLFKQEWSPIRLRVGTWLSGDPSKNWPVTWYSMSTHVQKQQWYLAKMIRLLASRIEPGNIENWPLRIEKRRSHERDREQLFIRSTQIPNGSLVHIVLRIIPLSLKVAGMRFWSSQSKTQVSWVEWGHFWQDRNVQSKCGVTVIRPAGREKGLCGRAAYVTRMGREDESKL